MDRYTMGNDHVPILSRFGRTLVKEQENRPRRFNYSRARWEEFKEKTEAEVGNVNSEDVDRVEQVTL